MNTVDDQQTQADNHNEAVAMHKETNSLAGFLKRATAGVGLLLLPALAQAQNCALCYTQAAGSGQRFIAALRSGILILMIPPMAITIGIAVMAYRKRNQFNED